MRTQKDKTDGIGQSARPDGASSVDMRRFLPPSVLTSALNLLRNLHEILHSDLYEPRFHFVLLRLYRLSLVSNRWPIFCSRTAMNSPRCLFRSTFGRDCVSSSIARVLAACAKGRGFDFLLTLSAFSLRPINSVEQRVGTDFLKEQI